MAFMESHSSGEWDVKLVSRPSRPELETFLKRFPNVKICHNQNPDGSGGTELTVADLLKNWNE